MTTAPKPAVQPASASIRLGAWNYYFIAKLLLFWRELIDFHPLENLAFATLLLLPAVTPGRRRIKLVLATPAAAALLYYDSWLPPIGRAFSQANLLAHFDAGYLIELAGRFISWPVVAMLVLAWSLYRLVARRVRVGVLVMSALAALALFHALPSGQPLVAAAPGAAAGNGGGNDQSSLDAALQAFYASESRRSVKFARPSEGELPFDLIFLHVCSLSWDDLQATGLDRHPLWSRFDFVMRRFNSAASYSGPAAIRIRSATCGQSSHEGLYSRAPDSCYLMASLKQAGFEPNLILNHDGHFDNFLSLIQKQGIRNAPMPLDGVPAPLRSFDSAPIHDDLAVLSRWIDQRQQADAPRVAAYYNTISLHDGNRFTAGADAKRRSHDTYKLRLNKLLDDLDGFMGRLESKGRRTVVVLVPEHGAALRGDKMQIAGMREIPTPAVTLVPVGIKVIGPGARRLGEAAVITESTSYLAMSHIVSRMLDKSPYAPEGFTPADYTEGLPLTEFVAENEGAVMMQRGDKFYLRLDKEEWKEYAAH